MNEIKSKVMKCTRRVDGQRISVALNGKLIQDAVFQIFRVSCCYGWRGR